jgi:hypothetical protein
MINRTLQLWTARIRAELRFHCGTSTMLAV